ncbi:two component transcriptional regulator, LuxR family [Deinococcus reticulitermitis]|uniref:Two component transcriptional regulator, LuxR family n=1 Tax=Deinococcus reticulitermitis TaxID=856736 RepID=A0A1H7CWV7_9DEIO|nr:response regulator transcription factor [Deinococcus reticulitermitis]SEJ94203.1 two component transcriptional regulator, LuxR family [Deinococcus reticulitermitis]
MTASEPPIRVLIADDHALFRDGLRALLLAAPEFEVIGEAATGDDAVHLALRELPQLILMDLQMPGLSGVQATRRIMAEHPELHVLMLTMFDDDASVFDAMRAGARGYLLKGAGHQDVLRALHAAASGEAIFSPGIAARLGRYFAGLSTHRQPDAFPQLTAREQEVLALIAQGRSNAGIARQLDIRPKTVRNHITSIFDKLQVADRAEAILRARAAGWDTDEE